jgi:hypothetical protein
MQCQHTFFNFYSVVAHALIYRPNVNETALAEQGATISGSGTFSVHGYATSSMEDGYSETLVDYDSISLHFFNDIDDDDDEDMATLTSVNLRTRWNRRIYVLLMLVSGPLTPLTHRWCH